MTGSFQVEAFHQLAALEAGTYWFESRNRLIAWALERYFPQARSFLEMGCGTGFVLAGLRKALPRIELAAAEMFPQGLAIARERVPDATFFLADARTFEAAKPYDVVGAFDVLEHIDDDAAAIGRLYDATAPGGGALITVPQHPALWSGRDEYACHVRRYRRRELIARLGAAGFRIVRATSFVSLLLPLMALSRLRRQPAAFDAHGELRVSPWLNLVLRRCLDVERSLIRTGISWPAGGSLLVVCTRSR
jgi:SAM-dependent methyltransferase